ncbi:hypothetical protein GOV12_02060 [Candidatus Pacearchaeota archaeon]|nr:hypothetical protein [Candidatus Pacearchaeota archaeon]
MEKQSTSPLQEEILRFLEETLGYGTIRDFMKETGKRDFQRLRKLIKPTLIGSFAKESSYSLDLPEDLKKYAWSRFDPISPHIFQSDEIDEQAKKKWYLKDSTRAGLDFRRLNHAHEEMKKRQFFLSNGNAGMGYTSGGIKRLVEGFQSSDVISDSHFSYSSENGFSLDLSNPDFYLYLGGGRNKDSNKVLIAAFNLPQDKVDELNQLSNNYHRFTYFRNK